MEYMPGKVIEPLEDSTRIDIAPRNILWQEDGSLCLVDWASAGYYPRIFEFCAQWIIEGKEGKFNKLLLDSMESLPDRELAQKVSILRAWRNSQKYSLSVSPRVYLLLTLISETQPLERSLQEDPPLFLRS